ncbi:MAG: TMEM175 family protein [Lactococcus lactis]|nr:TMEM175 family protein [Lactococcus lactis]
MKKRKVAVYEGHMLSTLKSFTDAVMSIIATIMVLEIPLPKFIGTNHYDFRETSSSLIIFFVSFLVVVSYYFQFSKFFGRIKKMSGWQIFAYTIFLMLVLLFPFMTQTDNGSHPAYFTIVYVIYIIVTSRFASLIIKAAYRLNEVKINRYQARKPWDLLAMSVIAIVISSLGYSAYTGIPLLYLPIRSLVTSIVYDED